MSVEAWRVLAVRVIAEPLAVSAEGIDFEVVPEQQILELRVEPTDHSYHFVLVVNTVDLLAIQRHHIQLLKPIAVVERIRTAVSYTHLTLPTKRIV